MASELTVAATLQFAKGNVVSHGFAKANLHFDVTGSKYVRAVQNIGTDAEAIGLGEITAPGWFYIFNLDSANYVEILAAIAGDEFLKIEAGEVAMGRFAASVTAPAAKANTSALNIEYLIVED